MDPPLPLSSPDPLHAKIKRLIHDAPRDTSPGNTFIAEIWPKVERDYHDMLTGLLDFCKALVKDGATIEGRVKKVDSIQKSIDRRQRHREEHREMPYQSVADVLWDVHDLVGVRIVLDFTSRLESVNQLIMNAFHQKKEPNVFGSDRPVGYQWKPWFGAYQSLNHHVSIKSDTPGVLEPYQNVMFEVQVTCLSESLYNRLAHRLLYKNSPGNLSKKDEMVIDLAHGVSLCYSICLLYFEDTLVGPEQLSVMKEAAPSPDVNDGDGNLSQLDRLVFDRPAGGPSQAFAPRMPSFERGRGISSGNDIKVQELLSFLALPKEKSDCMDSIWVLIERSIRETIQDMLKPPTQLPEVPEARPDSESVRGKGQCHQGTRIKILDKIESWASNPDAKAILWLHAPAGTGKSTITRTLATRCKNQNTLAAGYFFDRQKNEENRSRTCLLFPTIASQLVKQIPTFQISLRDSLAFSNRQGTEPNNIKSWALEDQFEILIRIPLSRLNSCEAKRRVIIIDALDECEEPEKLTRVIDLLSSLGNIKNPRLCILLTSRRVQPIISDVGQLSQDRCSIMPLHEEFNEEAKDDIRKLLESEFARIKDKKEIKKEWPDPRDVDFVVHQATTPEPLFIYAATLVRFIDNPKGKRNSVPRFEKWIKQCRQNKSQLGQIYKPILSEALEIPDEGGESSDDDDGKQILLKLLGAIVCVVKPLSANALASLLSLCKTDVTHWLEHLHPVLRIPKDDDNLPITIFHKSFSDFLLGEELPRNCFDSHEQLAAECLNRITSFSELRKEIFALNDPTIDFETSESVVPHIPDVIWYACEYWVHHWLKSKQIEGKIGTRVEDFLNSHFFLWIEILCLNRSIFAGEMAMREAHKLLSVCVRAGSVDDQQAHSQQGQPSQSEISHRLLEFFKDAQIFTLEHGSTMWKYPLQVRGFGFIFWPSISPLKRTLSTKLPPFIEKTTGDPSQWFPRPLQIIELPDEEEHYFPVLSFSPDGQTMVVAHPKCLTFWDVGTGTCLQTVDSNDHLPGDEIIALAFGEDGNRIDSVSREGKVQVWAIDTGDLGYTCTTRCTLQAPGLFKCAAISRHRLLIATSATIDGGSFALELWDFETGKQCGKLKDYPDDIVDMALSPHDTTLAVQFSSGVIDLWNTLTQLQEKTLKVELDTMWEERVCEIDYSPTGIWIATESCDGIKLWDITAFPHTVCRSHGLMDPLTRLLQGGTRLEIFDDESVIIWDISSIKQPSSLMGDVTIDPSDELVVHPSLIQAMALASDRQTLATSSQNHGLLLWDLQSGSIQCDRSTEAKMARAMAFSPDVTILAVLTNLEVQFWKIDTSRQLNLDWTQQLPPGFGDGGFCSFSTHPSTGELILGMVSKEGRKWYWNLETRLCQEEDWFLESVPISVSDGIPEHYNSLEFAYADNRLVMGHLDGQFALLDFNLSELGEACVKWSGEYGFFDSESE